jgi:hypothetical protein
MGRSATDPAGHCGLGSASTSRWIASTAAIFRSGVRCGVALMPVMVRRRGPAGHAYHEKAIRDGRDRQAKPVRLREL